MKTEIENRKNDKNERTTAINKGQCEQEMGDATIRKEKDDNKWNHKHSEYIHFSLLCQTCIFGRRDIKLKLSLYEFSNLGSFLQVFV